MRLRRRGINYCETLEPSFLRKADVEEYANNVRKAAKFEIGSSIASVVEDEFGGRIQYLDLDEWANETGSIYVHEPWDFDIVLPQYTSATRDQFTIAHELGHYFLHSEQGDRPIIATRNNEDTRVEWEANWFAAGLLMPADLFRKHFERLHDLDLIAAKFAVSRDAARVRCKVLGINV